MTRIRLVIVDEQAVFREGLVRLLCNQPPATTSAKLERGLPAPELDRYLPSDLVVLDVELPARLQDQLPIAINSAPPAVEVDLTTREREVLGLIGHGLSNKQIAVRLVLSPHTVKNHVRHILAKLQLSSRRQAACWVRQGGFQP
jgi:DNA-binding NarL/FixJ family response regulator